MLDSLVLRSRAENRLRATRSQLSDMPAREVQDLVHELQLYQIELQMQNDELRRTQEELIASRQRYADLYEFAPIGYVTLTRQGLVVEANFLGSLWLGNARNEMKGRKFCDFIKPCSQDDCHLHFARVFETGGRQSCELHLKNRDMVVQVSSQVHIPEDGYCCVTLTDISHLVEPNRPFRPADDNGFVGTPNRGL
jgi:PAS domain-containing protein